MSGRLEGRTCLLMGGGSSSAEGGPSNGQAVALTFAREGARVAVVDMHLALAEDTVRQITSQGGTAFALQADVSRHADVRAVVDATVERYGRIDILYNNVGIEVRGGVTETSEADWDRVHDVNLKSVFLSCKEVVPRMASQGGGVILNVASIPACAGVRRSSSPTTPRRPASTTCRESWPGSTHRRAFAAT